MKGRNTLVLNPLTMREALEQYLKTEFDLDARVDSVTQQELGGNAHQFKIEFTSLEKEAE